MKVIGTKPNATSNFTELDRIIELLRSRQPVGKTGVGSQCTSRMCVVQWKNYLYCRENFVRMIYIGTIEIDIGTRIL